MNGWKNLSRLFRQFGWGISVLAGTLSMAVGIFTAGAAGRLRLWKVSRLVLLPPVLWTASGFLGVCRATRRLDCAR